MFIRNLLSTFANTKRTLDSSVRNEITAIEFNSTHKSEILTLLREAYHILCNSRRSVKLMLTNNTCVSITDAMTYTMAGDRPSDMLKLQFYYRGTSLCRCELFVNKLGNIDMQYCKGPTDNYVYFKNDPNIRKHTPTELAEHPLFDKAYSKCMSLLLQFFTARYYTYNAQRQYNEREQLQMASVKRMRADIMLNEFINTNKS